MKINNYDVKSEIKKKIISVLVYWIYGLEVLLFHGEYFIIVI